MRKTRSNTDMEIEAAESDEIEKREREVQLIKNIVEPDPEYQALFISDEN